MASVVTSKCIAHRGNSTQFVENSYEALTSAFEIGADGVEFDVLHTKDNVPIVFHDRTFKRLGAHKLGKKCSLKKKIKHMSMKHIRTNCTLKEGGSIPTFKKVLKYFKSKKITLVIELKDKPRKQLIKLLQKYLKKKLLHDVHVISFKKKYLDIIEKKIGSSKLLKLVLINKYSPIPLSDYYTYLNRFWLKFDFLFSIFHKKQKGVWTVDTEEDLKKAIDRHFAFIITNYPARCLKLVGR